MRTERVGCSSRKLLLIRSSLRRTSLLGFERDLREERKKKEKVPESVGEERKEKRRGEEERGKTHRSFLDFRSHVLLFLVGSFETHGNDSFLLLMLDLGSERFLLDIGGRVVGVVVESGKEGKRVQPEAPRRRQVRSRRAELRSLEEIEWRWVSLSREETIRMELKTHESLGSSSGLSRRSGSERFDDDPPLFDVNERESEKVRIESRKRGKHTLTGSFLTRGLTGFLVFEREEGGKPFQHSTNRTARRFEVSRLSSPFSFSSWLASQRTRNLQSQTWNGVSVG